ncbi:MAG: glycosyltransferase family 2 protein [Patescibacteria group bacterium]
MDLSIIIVNWKVKDLLEKCLKSIFEQTKDITFEVFVVDNNSGDGSVEMVREKFPQVDLTASAENLGFAKGNNLAIKKSRGRYILLLNPDTEILDNALGKMVQFMDTHPECGIGGCKLLNPDLSLQPSVRAFPDLASQIFILLKIHHLLPHSKTMYKYLVQDFDYEKIQEADQVMGAFMLIRREVINKIGMLDENFWIWFEEVDFCKRAKEADFKILYTPEAKIIHHFGQSFKQAMGIKKQKDFNRSLSYYFKKHGTKGEWLAIQILRPLSLILAWSAQSFKK